MILLKKNVYLRVQAVVNVYMSDVCKCRLLFLYFKIVRFHLSPSVALDFCRKNYFFCRLSHDSLKSPVLSDCLVPNTLKRLIL